MKEKGFTIVELLIVIVVIAILAAITVVAYNGIQERARNAQVIAGVNTYYKALLEYKAIYSSYPTQLGCLGANYPSNQCWSGTSGTWSVSVGLDNNLAEFISNKPTLATALFSIGVGDNQRSGLLWRGDQLKMIWYLQGPGQSCSVAGASSYTEGGIVTQCVLTLS